VRPPRLVGEVVCELGEGPVWRAGERALWWVDILEQRIWRLDPATGETDSWPSPERIGFIEPVAGGGWIAGLKSGLHRFDERSGSFERLYAIEDPALDNRLNDAFVDAAGRLWFGSMHDERRRNTGALYSLDDRGVTRHVGGYGITNGPCTSPDGRVFYHTDTRASTIDAFDLSEGGDLTDRRAFARIDPADGWPDGSTVDAEGCVWTALWGGWGVRRYSPKGEVIGFVRLPVANVTKIAFGGDDLSTAYVTTAWSDLTPAERVEQPLAGRLFSFASGTHGQPQYEVASTGLPRRSLRDREGQS
jgi:D-xylonolactonase